MNVDTTTLVILLSTISGLVALVVAVDRRWAAMRGGAQPERPPASRVRHAVDVVFVAAWFGLVAGVVHLFLAFVNRYIRNHFLMVSQHIIWLAPLSYVLLFVSGGLIVAVAALVFPRRISLRLAITGFTWLGVFSMFLPFIQLHRLAAAALAAGVAVQIGLLMSRRSTTWLAVMRATAWPVAGGIAIVALALAGWRAAAEPLALRRLPRAQPGAPNVLLVVLDTVRATNLSLYGYGRPTTPELERWAKDGTTFNLAFSTAPWTLKSHATMFTGLYPSQIGGDFEVPVSTDSPMLAEIFRDQGYVTGGFVANLLYTSYESGLTRGFSHYDDYHVSLRQVVLHSWLAQTPLFRDVVNIRSLTDSLTALRHASLKFEPNTFNSRTYTRKSASEINEAFLEWQATRRGRPFFAFLNYFDAHQGYQAPAAFARGFHLSEQPSMGRYDGAIAYIDHEIGRLLEDLKSRGVLDNTVVIVTSDHGEQFGEHGLTEHANSLYLPLLRVPLFIRFPPRVAPGVRVETPVTLRDLAATVIDLAGLTEVARVPGQSLVLQSASGDRAISGSAIVAEVERSVRPEPNAPVFFGPMRTALDERFQYIRRGDGLEELYAYHEDAQQIRSLSRTPEGQQQIARLRSLLP